MTPAPAEARPEMWLGRNKPRAPAVLGPFMHRSPLMRRSLFASVLLVCSLAGIAACERKGTPGADGTDTRAAQQVGSAPTAQVATPEAGAPPAVEKVEVPEVRIRTGGDTTVRVTWITPKGTTVNDEAPFRVRWNRSDGLADAPNDVKSTGSAVKDGFVIKVRPMPGAPNATLDGEINIVVCDDVTHSVCVPVRRSVELGFIAANDATDQASVAIPLPAAK